MEASLPIFAQYSNEYKHLHIALVLYTMVKKRVTLKHTGRDAENIQVLLYELRELRVRTTLNEYIIFNSFVFVSGESEQRPRREGQRAL
jgi:hypothetical protein